MDHSGFNHSMSASDYSSYSSRPQDKTSNTAHAPARLQHPSFQDTSAAPRAQLAFTSYQWNQTSSASQSNSRGRNLGHFRNDNRSSVAQTAASFTAESLRCRRNGATNSTAPAIFELEGDYESDEEFQSKTHYPQNSRSTLNMALLLSPNVQHCWGALRTDHSLAPQGAYNPLETTEQHLPPDPSAAAVNRCLAAQLASETQALSLLRRFSVPRTDDFSQIARCVRFAQLFSQKFVNWKLHPRHVAEIYRRANWYGMELLVGRTDIAFGTGMPADLDQEFRAILGLRSVREDGDGEATAAYIDTICADLEHTREAGYILGILTAEDRVRFAAHLVRYDQEHAAWVSGLTREDFEDEEMGETYRCQRMLQEIVR